MVKESIKLHLAQSMTVNGKLENITELVLSNGLMAAYLKANGRIAEKMEKESLLA